MYCLNLSWEKRNKSKEGEKRERAKEGRKKNVYLDGCSL
jgi:hypothetical protein